MNLRYQKALRTTALFSLTAAMLTLNFDQAYAEPSFERISLDFYGRFQSDHNDPTSLLTCPNSNQVEVSGQLILERGIAVSVDEDEGEVYYSNPNPVDSTRFDIHQENPQPPEYNPYVPYLDPYVPSLTFNIFNWRITGAPPNQEFMIEGLETRDTICGSRTPTDFTFSGSCEPGSRGTFETTNGQRGVFLITQATPFKSANFPMCTVCPQGHVGFNGWFNPGLDCREEGIEMSGSESMQSNESTANPGDVDASIVQVKPGDIPQPKVDGEQEIQSGDEGQTDENEITDAEKSSEESK